MISMVRYLIIGWSRSGTTITHLAIKGHPQVSALNDELRVEPFFTKGISTFTHGNDYREEKEKGYSALFDALTLIGANDETIAHGVKIACNSHKQASHLVFVLKEYLKDIKVIIVVRKDMVALLGSALMGRKTGIMHSWYEGFKQRKIEQIKINNWRLTSFAINVFKMYKVLRELKKTHDVLEIEYEDLLIDPASYYSRLFKFLNLTDMEPTWIDSKKVLPAPENYIKNYHSLQKRLSDIETGNLSSYMIFYSRAIGYMHWIAKSFFPKKLLRKFLQK